MAEKSEFVDMISDATRQVRRRVMPRVIKKEAQVESGLSHWPPERWQQWRIETLSPWRQRLSRFKNWE
jgi:hypothetical protein